MKHQITHVDPIQSGKVAAVMLIMFSLPISLILFFTLPFGKAIITLIVFPLVYGLTGFLMNAFFSWIYNVVVVPFVGGIQYETSSEDGILSEG